MDWQTSLALILVFAAAAFVGWRAWGAVFGSGKAGCGSGCGSCGANQQGGKKLLSIEDRS
jgi:hypothetical protein